MRKISTLLLTATFLSSISFQPILADDWHGHGDFHGFHDHGFDHWRSGRWFNGFHDGRNGWWWIVDGIWYFYPAPVYPYPDPYTPPTVVVETTPIPAGAQVYYYCANPAGYYPQVPQCPVAWQRVISAPATQPQVIVTPAPQPVPAPQAAAPIASQRDIDLQQINTYAAQLRRIDYKDSHVRARLKELEKQVEVFRQSLFKRDYNAMSIMKDAEDLKKRIEEQRNWLAKHKDGIPPTVTIAPAPATTAPPSAPTSLPPGATITFPPPPQ